MRVLHACVVLTVATAAATMTGCTSTPAASTHATSTTRAASPPTTATSSTGLDATFRVRANAACKPFADWNKAHPFTFQFDPANPDPKLLPKAGAFFDASPVNHSFMTALRALGEPAAGRTAWSSWLGELDASVAVDRAQIAAAKKADVAAFKATVNQVLAQQPALDAAVKGLGFGPADPCARVL